jgi:predicted PurR-regulated permease PerM
MYAERILMGLLLGIIALGCGVVLYPFFTSILWAAILAFSTWPVYQWLKHRLKINGIAASMIMVVICTLALVLPFALIGPDSAKAISDLRVQFDSWIQNGLPPAPDWLQNVPFAGAELVDRWNIWAADLTGLTDAIRPYAGSIAEHGFNLLFGLAGGVARIMLALFIAFFFWLSGDKISVHLRAGLLRIAGPRGSRMIDVAGRAVRGTVYGIIGTSIVQGVLTGIGLSIAGVGRPIILGTIAGFLSVLPIGPPLVWGGAAVWLYANHHTGKAIFLVAWGIILVSGSDSLIRPYFIARGARIPFLLTLLGVLGGAVAFGLLGVFLGPTLLAIGYSLVTEFVAVVPVVETIITGDEPEPL